MAKAPGRCPQAGRAPSLFALCTARRALLGSALCAASSGCLPSERINASCQWRADAAPLAPPGDRARRAHLIQDVRLAEDLGIRYADSTVGRPPRSMAEWERARRWCMDRALGAVARRYAPVRVTRAELEALAGARDWWFDLLAILLPAAALFLLLSRRVAERVVAGNDPTDWWVPALVLMILTPIVAGVWLALTHLWAWTAETLRLRNGHISHRAFQLPTSRHAWLLWGVGVTLFAAASAAALLRAQQAARGQQGGRSRPGGLAPEGRRGAA